MNVPDVADDNPLLELAGVTVRFGGLVALDDAWLRVSPGEVAGVIGPNGAGKTTLFNVVSGFVRPQTGELRWRGDRLVRHRPHHLAGLGISRTLQSLGLFAGLTVAENVMVAGSRDRALARLDELGIAAVADRLPGELPYGVQKRVALARALVGEPALLLLDEPAAGLSADEIGELGDLVDGLREHCAVVLVEHHMDLVMEVCDLVTVLDFGKVIAHGTPEEIRGDPAVIDAYLGETVPGGPG